MGGGGGRCDRCWTVALDPYPGNWCCDGADMVGLEVEAIGMGGPVTGMGSKYPPKSELFGIM